MISFFKSKIHELFRRKVDYIRVVGKNNPLAIYELIASNENISENQNQFLTLFDNGFNEFYKQHWHKANDYFEQALKISALDTPSKMFIDRCEVYSKNPPLKGWDGVLMIEGD